MEMQELATKPVDELKSRITPTLTTIRFFESKFLCVSIFAETRSINLLMSKR